MVKLESRFFLYFCVLDSLVKFAIKGPILLCLVRLSEDFFINDDLTLRLLWLNAIVHTVFWILMAFSLATFVAVAVLKLQ